MTWHTAIEQPNELGESPFWHPQEQALYWVDIALRKVLRCRMPAGTVESWPMPSEPGCIAPAHGGGLVIALRDGVYRAATWGGDLTRIATLDYDPATSRVNDGKADPMGRFWAGTMYEPRDQRIASLYSIDMQNGKALVQKQATGATVGNGVAWSPDARTLYWSDTTSHSTRAWNWDAKNNLPSGERVFRQWPLKPEGWKPGQPDSAAYGGRPDGASVDAEGNYYAAMFEGARLVKLSPAGDLLADIAVPAMCPTMPCFGGDDLKTLYLTTAREKRSEEELERYPLSGCILAMQVDVPGLPVNFFAG